MTHTEPGFDLASIRDLIEAAFMSGGELRRFCQKRPEFQPALKLVNEKASMAEHVDILIGFCETRVLWAELLAGLKEENPRQFALHSSRIGVPGSYASEAEQVPGGTLSVHTPTYPYESFMDSVREVVGPKKYDSSGAVLHVVFGDISDLRHTTPTIPVSQSFDFWQRGSRSVLAKFNKVKVGNEDFFAAVERIWPSDQRPSNAGIGHTRFVSLPDNSHSLPGVVFVVTTRDVSSSPLHRGRYVDTPVAGIEYALDRVLAAADDYSIQSLAMPLLGVGYANIGRTWNRPQLKWLLREAVLALTICKLEAQLSEREHALNRGFVVVFSPEPHSQFEDRVWRFVMNFINKTRDEKTEQIDRLVRDLVKLEEERP